MDNYLKRDLDDIVFENRNQAYGAYALRKGYGKRIKKGIIGGVAVFLLLVSSPLIADKMKSKIVLLDSKAVTLMDAPKEDVKKPDVPPQPPPPPPPPMKKIETQRFVPPVVTIAEVKDLQMIVPPIDSNTQIGVRDMKGEKTSVYVAPSVPTASAPPPPEPDDKKVVETDIPFLIVEQNPEFKNGLKAMYKFMSDNVKYPTIARENGIEGTVFVGFVVGRDGVIRDVAVKRGIGGGCNEEAVRVISMMPAWNAGKQNGKAVSVAFTLPVKFTLQ
jgi:periplasmic protein TonB